MRTIRVALKAAVAIALLGGVAGADKTAQGTTPATAGKPVAPAAAGAGTKVVKDANETIATLLKQKPAAGSKAEKDLAAKVTTSVRGFLDIDELGKRAMATNWAKLTPAQQTEFSSVLRQLIETNYINGLRANLQYSVAYTGESTDASGNAVVDTKITAQKNKRPYSIGVTYVLVKSDGKLRAWDVKTDGVGLVENYRSMFDSIMKKGGAADLIARMKKKLGEMQAATPAVAPATTAR